MWDWLVELIYDAVGRLLDIVKQAFYWLLGLLWLPVKALIETILGMLGIEDIELAIPSACVQLAKCANHWLPLEEGIKLLVAWYPFLLAYALFRWCLKIIRGAS